MIDNPLNRLYVKRGSQLPHSKLTEDDVIAIRALVDYRSKLLKEAKTLTNAKIAEKFDVSDVTIERIASGERWGHIV